MSETTASGVMVNVGVGVGGPGDGVGGTALPVAAGDSAPPVATGVGLGVAGAVPGAGLGGQSGLRFGLAGSSLVSSASRRSASGSLLAWMPCFTRSWAARVRSSRRDSLRACTSDRSRPATWPGTPRNTAS